MNKRPGTISLSKTCKMFGDKYETRQTMDEKLMQTCHQYRFDLQTEAPTLTSVRNVFVNPPPSMPCSSLNSTHNSQPASYLKQLQMSSQSRRYAFGAHLLMLSSEFKLLSSTLSRSTSNKYCGRLSGSLRYSSHN